MNEQVRSQASTVMSSNRSPNISEQLEQATQKFHEGQYQQCLQIQNNLLEDLDGPKFYQILMNRASLHLTMQNYTQAIVDCKKYITENKKQIDPQIYVLYLSGLIKEGEIQSGMEVFKEANEMFPYHKKIGELGKLCKEKSMTNNEDTYVENMFQKLIMHPKIREYCKDQAFLTKIERMIRNPSLTSALEKMDPRIKQAAEVMMMADQNWH